MDTALAHLTTPVVVRSVVDQPLLVGAAGVVVVLAILLVFVMVLRSGSRRDVGIGLDGRQEPYGQPRARPSQPNPFGPNAFGQTPYNSQDPYRAWQPDDRRMAGGEPSNSGWGAAYDNGSMAGPMQQSPWGAPASGSRPSESGWGANQQASAWQDQNAWGTANSGQAQRPWGQAEAPAVAAPPWAAPTESNNWGSAIAGANGQGFAPASGQGQPYGQGYGAGPGADPGFGAQAGAGFGNYGGSQGAGYGAPGQAGLGGGGWSTPDAAAGLPPMQTSTAGGRSSDDRGAYALGGDMPRAARSGGSVAGATLVVRQGKEPGKVYELRSDRTTIGRSRESDVFLEDLAVSRNHTTISRDEQGRYILRDEASANGTLVNSQPVTGPVVLQFGDTIQVGQTIMTFSRR